jgi:Asp-tRNA(Asn)/Glu-tRNA(Gln) amidotransferase A subunit family amidase
MIAPLSVSEFAKKAIQGQLSITEHTSKILEEIRKANPKFHFFVAINEAGAMQQKIVWCSG